MKPSAFEYFNPQSVQEALDLLNRYGDEAKIIAGGQSLVPMMNFRLAQPERLIDLGALEPLRSIRDHGDAIEIGAMTTYSELDQSETIADHFPLLKTALPHIAHPAIRNRGTIGGSAALADPAAELPALLLAVEARLNVVSASGERSVNADDFFVGTYETDLAADELVRSITIPKVSAGARFAFYELARRHGDYAMVGTALAADASRHNNKCEY